MKSSKLTVLSFFSQENELHSTHSFQWNFNKIQSNQTCSEAGTVLDSLMKSTQFSEIAKKNKGKELVIMKDGRAISSHHPCCLIKRDEHLTVKYVKALNSLKKRKNPASKIKTPCELVEFHVFAKGGKNVARIIKNPALRAEIQEVTIYSYEGERVKSALRRDGRFDDVIFKKNCVLIQKSTGVKTEFSNQVHDFDGKTYEINLLNKSSPPDSQPGSLDDAYVEVNEHNGYFNSENGNLQNNKNDLNANMTAGKALQEIPGSKMLQGHLSSEFEESVKGMKGQAGRLSRIQNLVRVEYEQNVQMCREVKTMKKLMELSNSVCQVRINGSPVGSGFLLFGRYVFTCGHVIKGIYNDNWGQLTERVSVHFSYESVEQTDTGLDVKEVICFEYHPDTPGLDFALLRVSDDQKLPLGLLKNLGGPPKEGGICIIGHPDGAVKCINPCLIIPSQNQHQVVEKHYNENVENLQLVTSSFFGGITEYLKQAVTYESCFYFGSSGSPVFDKYCNVVAVHSGGYVYTGKRHEQRSVIEFGNPLVDLLERLIIQMVERKRFDVLKEYLALDCSWHSHILCGIKKLIESRNLTKCKAAINSLVDADDIDLNKFCAFLSQTEEPVPMEVNQE